MEGKTVRLTLEERIAELEDEIRGYKTLLKKAIANGDDVREERYSDLIKTRGRTLDNLILQQREERQLLAQHQQQQGNQGISPSYDFNFMLL
jgi:hypothetical protein